jgi:type II secretory pathway pseudopilin PulG
MRTSESSAFSLVEVVIAIGVAAFCLVAMLGLIPTGVKSVKTATEQTVAAALLQEVATDLRNTQPGSNTTPKLGLSLTNNGTATQTPGLSIGSGSGGITSPFYMSESGIVYTNNTSMDARYGVFLNFTNQSTFITAAQIVVWWPSTSSLTNAQGSIETVTTILRQ